MLKTTQNCSPLNLLKYIDNNKDQIECKHIMIVLSLLHEYYTEKSMPSNESEKIDFSKLCICFKKQINQLGPNEVMDALNMLQLLKVPSSNLFVITLLQRLKDSYEEFSSQELKKLSTLLVKLAPTDLFNKINSFLQDKFFEKASELDTNNLYELMNAMYFESKNLKDLDKMNFFKNCIENYSGEYRLEEALAMFTFLTSMKHLSFKFTNTELRLKKVIIDNIDNLEYHDVLHIIEDISSQVNSK